MSKKNRTFARSLRAGLKSHSKTYRPIHDVKLVR